MENAARTQFQTQMFGKTTKKWMNQSNGFRKSALLFLLFVIIISGSSCKKGEDDPFISLNSRKARLQGDWRFVSGDLVIGTTDINSWTRYNEVYVFTGSGYEMTSTGTVNAVVSKGTFILSLRINKEGHFSVEEIFDGKVFEAEGNWDFNSGVSDKKSKSEVSFEITNVSKGVSGGYHLLNQSSTNFSYKIKELRSDRLVLEIDKLIYQDMKGPKQTFYGEFVFVQ